uniref:Smoothelin domain-containing protein n=1 Tax=Anopheles dirus TaxID=7168 RepID=A0A182NMY6_9DIPT
MSPYWQQAEDFMRKKEIRAYMYKLREQRLKDFYASNDSSPPYFLMDNASATFGLKKSTVAGSHGDSLVDQSFESFKTKEIRDSESPTRFGSMAAIPTENSGWQIRTSEQVSEDGKTHTVRSSATTQGAKEIYGGRTAFAGKNLESHSEHYDGDEKNFVHSKGDQSTTVLVEDSIVEGDDGRTLAGTHRSTTTSVSSSHIVRQQQNGEAGWSKKQLNDAVDYGMDESFVDSDQFLSTENRSVTATSSSITSTLDNTTFSTTQSNNKQISSNEQQQQAATKTNKSTTPKELSKDPQRVREAFRLAQGAGTLIEREETMVNASTKMITQKQRLDDGTTVTTRTYEKNATDQPESAASTVAEEYRSATTTKKQSQQDAVVDLVSRPDENKATSDFIRHERATQSATSSTSSQRISVDVDAAHESFARSLRSVSPTGSVRSNATIQTGRSIVSPDKAAQPTCGDSDTKPDYMRATFTSERKVSGFQEPGSSSRSPSPRKTSATARDTSSTKQSSGGASSILLEHEYHESSSTTSNTDRNDLQQVDGVKGDRSESKKPPLVRSETYEERCRKILGMPNRRADEEGKVEPKSNVSIFSTYDNTVATVQQQTRSELREQRKKIEQEVKLMESKTTQSVTRRTSNPEQTEVDLAKERVTPAARKPSHLQETSPTTSPPTMPKEDFPVRKMSSPVRHSPAMNVSPTPKTSPFKEASTTRKPLQQESTATTPKKEASPVRQSVSPTRKPFQPVKETSPVRKSTPASGDGSLVKQVPRSASPYKEPTITKSKATILVEPKKEGHNISVAEITLLPVMEVSESVRAKMNTVRTHEKVLMKQFSDTKFDRRTTTAANSRVITNKSSSDFDVKRRVTEMATQKKARTPATSPDKRRPQPMTIEKSAAPAKQNHITVAKIKIDSMRKPAAQKSHVSEEISAFRGGSKRTEQASVQRRSVVEPETDPESSKDTGISDNSEVDETVESVIEMNVTGTSCCRHTDRKDSAPVYRTTGAARTDKSYKRSSSDNHLRTTNASQNRQQASAATATTVTAKSVSSTTGGRKMERPIKHVATKTINLSAKAVGSADSTLNTTTDHMDNVVIDIQLAKSSREPTPNKLVPIPMSPDTEDTGKPRYPDAVLEPDDEASPTSGRQMRTTPGRINNIPIFEEATNEYVGCEITEVDEQQDELTSTSATQHATRITNLDRVTEDDESLLSVTEKVSKFVQEAHRLQEPVPELPRAQPARFTVRSEYEEIDEHLKSDECLLSVSDKVTKFISTAEEVKRIRTSGPFVPASDAGTANVTEDDECLLSVNEKVNRFANRMSQVSEGPTVGRTDCEEQQYAEAEQCQEEQTSGMPESVGGKFVPQKSPELVKNAMRSTARHVVEDGSAEELMRTSRVNIADRYRTTTMHKQSPVVASSSGSITLRSTEAVKKAKEIFEKGQSVAPQDACQRDILNRPSIWEDRRSKQQQQQQRQVDPKQNDVKLTDIGVYERFKNTQTVREDHTSVDGATTRRKDSLTKVAKPKPEPEAVPSNVGVVGRRDSGSSVRAPAYIRDTVSSKKDLFEKRISSSKLQVEYTTQISQDATESAMSSMPVAMKSALKQQQPEPGTLVTPAVSRQSVDQSKPSYMNHTVASLEHINANQRRDSLDHGVIIPHEATIKSGSAKFGVELKRPDTGSRGTAPVTSSAPSAATISTKRKVSAGEAGQPNASTPVIEEIFDVEVLERMLESVTGYEQRRRIRAQIRVVKKQKDNKTSGTITQASNRQGTGSSNVTTSTTKSVTTTYSTAVSRDAGLSKRNDSSPTRATTVLGGRKSSTTTADTTSALDTNAQVEIDTFIVHEKEAGKHWQQESRNATNSVTTNTKVTTLKTDRLGSKAGDRQQAAKDDRPIWATSNILKKPSENSRSFKSSSVTTASTGGGASPMSRKVVSTTSTTTYQQTKATSDPKATTDCITSSYGVGPTDENGLPLFGIRALKKKATPVVAIPVEDNCHATQTTGAIVTETMYAENGRPVVSKHSTMHYSSEPASMSELTGDEREPQAFNRNRSGGLMAIRKTVAIDANDADSEELEVLDGAEIGAPGRREAKVVRKGSVKELTERFIHRESSGTLTQESVTRTYPKAGLILRSSAQSQSSRASTPNATDACSVRSSSIDEFEQQEHEQESRRQVRTFLNDTSKVVDVRDVVQRMNNADNVTEQGDTVEDQEARALLNKFLGASVLMSGVESMVASTGCMLSEASCVPSSSTKKLVRSNPVIVTLREMIECTVARPSRTMNKNLAAGNSSITYEPILSVSGSLLQRRGAGSPCLAMISRQNCAIAPFSTSLVMPASTKRTDSFSDFIQCDRSCRMRGMTRVSCPQL